MLLLIKGSKLKRMNGTSKSMIIKISHRLKFETGDCFHCKATFIACSIGKDRISDNVHDRVKSCTKTVLVLSDHLPG